MVTKSSTSGLIVSTSTECSAPLDDLIACCDWPVLLEANARRLRQEFDLRIHECVLFWLEARQQAAATAKLVEWMRERQRETYRVAVAYRLDDDAEAAMRTAGVNCYLPAFGDIVGLAEDTLWPMLDRECRPAKVMATPPFRAATSGRAGRDGDAVPEVNRPP